MTCPVALAGDDQGMHIQTDRAFIPAATPSVRYLQVRVGAPPAPARAGRPRPPAEIALVLDRSGSMGGSKMQMARTAVQQAVRLLKSHDHLAVVCYDDQVHTVLARTPASAEAKTLALDRLALIDARGSTNLSGGWLKGAEELAGARGDSEASGLPAEAGSRTDASPPADAPRPRRRVLLLTDGLANQGETDPDALAAAAAGLRADGITTSTFGVGADFDEVLLSRLATDGGGHFYFIEQARQIPDLLASELGEALEVVARDATFEITCRPGAEATLVHELPYEPVPHGIRVRLGDLVAEQELTFVVAVHVTTPPALGSGMEVTCRLADRDGALFGQPMFVDWPAVSIEDDAAQPVNAEVVRAFAAALVARAQAAALAANRSGDFTDARRIIREAIDMLRTLAPGDPAVGALIAELEDDAGEFSHAMSPVALKQRHFVAYSIANSRDLGGRARRRSQAS